MALTSSLKKNYHKQKQQIWHTISRLCESSIDDQSLDIGGGVLRALATARSSSRLEMSGVLFADLNINVPAGWCGSWKLEDAKRDVPAIGKSEWSANGPATRPTYGVFCCFNIGLQVLGKLWLVTGHRGTGWHVTQFRLAVLSPFATLPAPYCNSDELWLVACCSGFAAAEGAVVARTADDKRWDGGDVTWKTLFSSSRSFITRSDRFSNGSCSVSKSFRSILRNAKPAAPPFIKLLPADVAAIGVGVRIEEPLISPNADWAWPLWPPMAETGAGFWTGTGSTDWLEDVSVTSATSLGLPVDESGDGALAGVSCCCCCCCRILFILRSSTARAMKVSSTCVSYCAECNNTRK